VAPAPAGAHVTAFAKSGTALSVIVTVIRSPERFSDVPHTRGRDGKTCPTLRASGGGSGSYTSGMALGGLTQEELARLLREAEAAHGKYEQELGRRDDDWSSWYAGWILEKLEERGTGPGP
jgi:hypothetical protein